MLRARSSTGNSEGHGQRLCRSVIERLASVQILPTGNHVELACIVDLPQPIGFGDTRRLGVRIPPGPLTFHFIYQMLDHFFYPVPYNYNIIFAFSKKTVYSPDL